MRHAPSRHRFRHRTAGPAADAARRRGSGRRGEAAASRQLRAPVLTACLGLALLLPAGAVPASTATTDRSASAGRPAPVAGQPSPERVHHRAGRPSPPDEDHERHEETGGHGVSPAGRGPAPRYDAGPGQGDGPGREAGARARTGPEGPGPREAVGPRTGTGLLRDDPRGEPDGPERPAHPPRDGREPAADGRAEVTPLVPVGAGLLSLGLGLALLGLRMRRP